jgi:hypothetical protein
MYLHMRGSNIRFSSVLKGVAKLPSATFKRRLAIATLVALVGFTWDATTQRPAPASEPRQREAIVYVTKTGTKYHLDGCQYLRQSKIPIPLIEAVKFYDPCPRCRPTT